MKLKKTLSSVLYLCLLSGTAAMAQDVSKPELSDEQIEQEWINMKAQQGESHASGARDDLGPVILGNPTQSAVAIRVGIYYSFTAANAYSEFASLHHPFVQVSNTEGYARVIDQATGNEIALMEPEQIYDVRFDGTNYIVSGPTIGTTAVTGPVRFMPEVSTNQFKVESIRKANILASGSPATVPRYRGAIEVSRGSSTSAGRVNLVNIIEVEDYVKGVVANESIASFHIEALKSQATAARGYAIANIGNWIARGYPFDLVDSSSSQVYRGVISEHARAVLATEQTRGLVASYNGRIISALYSSSFGGHSDSNHWIFNSPSSQLPGPNVTPYLTSIFDGEGPAPDLTDPAVHQTFWSTIRPEGYDMCGRVNNRFARWKINIPAATIKARLTAGRYVLVSGTIGASSVVTGVEAAQRMEGSNRIARAAITLDTGIVEVRGWDNMRNVLGRSVVSTPAVCPNSAAIGANFTLTNPSILETLTNADGSFAGVNAYGGGWGHNTGMSQYGGHGRGLAGQTFLQILKAYYTGVDIGSYPIDISRKPGTGPPTLRQQFVAPNAIGTLVVRSTGLKKLVVHINGMYDLKLNEAELSDGIESVDLSPYLVSGLNTVQYNPVGQTGRVTVNVNVQ